MGDKLKILVCGHVYGRCDTLFSRVDSLNKKSGPFDLLLITGRLFGDNNAELENYKNGTKKVAIPTYVLGPSQESDESFYPENEGEEILPNLTYLGKRGVYTTSHGVKIAYLSGVQSNDSSNITFTANDCAAIRDACRRGQSEYRGVDILITSYWPADVDSLDRTKIDFGKVKSTHVSWLAMHIKPRYHFVPSLQWYYERAPYRNVSDRHLTRELSTRFIALAPIGNDRKAKWLYACSLLSINKMRMMDLLQGTTDETMCPYNQELLNENIPGSKQKSMDNQQYFYNMDGDSSENNQRKRKFGGSFEQRKKPEFDPEKCWFCLSSSSVEKHLVICVGEHCYLALAKGPLTPFHCLVLPVAHHQSTTQAPIKVQLEINKFKKSVGEFFKSMGDVPVFFERNFKTSHLQIQCVPVPKSCESVLMDEFEGQSSAEGIDLTTLSPDDNLCDIMPPGLPYFHVEIPGYQLYTKTKASFPLQLGRDILASSQILNCEEKADWRSCQLSKEEEIEFVSQFRKKFEPFNFTEND